MKTYESTKVIFRKFKTDGKEVIALFPQLIGTLDPFTCTSYMHVGQHSSANVDLVSATARASKAEYADLARELRGLGYVLDIASRFTSADLAERKKQVAA